MSASERAPMTMTGDKRWLVVRDFSYSGNVWVAIDREKDLAIPMPSWSFCLRVIKLIEHGSQTTENYVTRDPSRVVRSKDKKKE